MKSVPLWLYSEGNEGLMGEVICIGLDLAWSARNPTGAAVLVDGTLQALRADLISDADIVQWVAEWLDQGQSAVVAVDAPLCVPNLEGKRPCETQLGAEWRKYQAGPYPANRNRFADIGIRGEELVRQLASAYQFVEAAPVEAIVGGRFVCEVYPHPAHVSLFGLKSILKYKKKGKRSYAECWAELDRYQGYLRGLAAYEPPLHDPHQKLNHEFVDSRGKQLKRMEDELDAVTCAYVAWYLWRHGRAGAIVYGTLAEGHIIVPRYPLSPPDPGQA
jgi:predicted RNase H-like nuclease